MRVMTRPHASEPRGYRSAAMILANPTRPQLRNTTTKIMTPRSLMIVSHPGQCQTPSVKFATPIRAAIAQNARTIIILAPVTAVVTKSQVLPRKRQPVRKKRFTVHASLWPAHHSTGRPVEYARYASPAGSSMAFYPNIEKNNTLLSMLLMIIL